jgi:5-methylcytosine-specific restriction endonuclease McrA
MNTATLDNYKVLVLNKWLAPVGFKTLPEAFNKLFGTYANGQPKAVVMRAVRQPVPQPDGSSIEISYFEEFTWSDWTEIKPTEEDLKNNHVIRVRKGRLGEQMIFKLPAVIKLTRYDKQREQRVNFNRRTIYKRDDNTCQYCGTKYPTSELSLDHVIPKCQGGKTTWDNIVCCCVPCNSQKAGRCPEEARRDLMPRNQQKNWRGPSPMKLLKKPSKPKGGLLKGEKVMVLKDWDAFVSASYWNVELENQND